MMSPEVARLISSGIAGAVQLGAAGINYSSQQSANRQNIALANLQNQYNLTQWRRETDYNSPAAQVERLKAAGINPALAYANGSMMNEAASSPQMTAGRVQAPYISPVDLSQIRLNDALANKAQSEGQATEDANARANEQQPHVIEQLAEGVKNLREQTAQIHELLDGIKSDNRRKAIEALIAEETKDAAVMDIKAKAKLSHDQAEYYVLSLMTEIGLKESEEDLNRAKSLLTDAERRSVEQDIDLAKDYYKLAAEQQDWARQEFLANKPFLHTNAKNTAASLYYTAKRSGLEARLIQRYGDINNAVSILTAGSRAASDAAAVYLDIKSGGNMPGKRHHRR